MSDKEKADELTRKISASKKYKTLYYKTIERVVKNYLKAKTGGGPSSAEISTDKVEKRTRNLLHQIWGAYFPNRPNFEKLSDKLKESLKFGRGLASRVPARLNSQRIKEIILPFLNLQSSIKERVPILDGFYQKIFAITGQPKTIIDWACGLNPLSWPWMNLPEDCHYIGFDIDKDHRWPAFNDNKSAHKMIFADWTSGHDVAPIVRRLGSNIASYDIARYEEATLQASFVPEDGRNYIGFRLVKK